MEFLDLPHDMLEHIGSFLTSHETFYPLSATCTAVYAVNLERLDQLRRDALWAEFLSTRNFRLVPRLLSGTVSPFEAFLRYENYCTLENHSAWAKGIGLTGDPKFIQAMIDWRPSYNYKVFEGLAYKDDLKLCQWFRQRLGHRLKVNRGFIKSVLRARAVNILRTLSISKVLKVALSLGDLDYIRLILDVFPELNKSLFYRDSNGQIEFLAQVFMLFPQIPPIGPWGNSVSLRRLMPLLQAHPDYSSFTQEIQTHHPEVWRVSQQQQEYARVLNTMARHNEMAVILTNWTRAHNRTHIYRKEVTELRLWVTNPLARKSLKEYENRLLR